MTVVMQDKTFPTKTGTRQGFYMDETMLFNFDNHLLPPIHRDNMDLLMLYDGKEGTGKTTIATTHAYYCDPTFPGKDCERVVFSADELMRVADKMVRGQVVVFDEAILSACSEDHASEEQRKLMKFFQTIRSRGLIYFIIAPYCFMLRKYFILRSRGLIHTYMIPNKEANGAPTRAFKAYGHPTGRISTLFKLYIDGHKYMDYSVIKPDFKGRFTNTMGMFYDVGLYESKKQEAIKRINIDSSVVYKQELKARYDAQIVKLTEYKKQLKDKYTKLFEDYRQKNKMKIQDIRVTYEAKITELKAVMKTKGGKPGEIQAERDMLLYYIYEMERAGQELAMDTFCFQLRNKGINFDVGAVEAYINHGKALIT